MPNYEIALLKRKDGIRVIRFYEPQSGLAVEKRLDPLQPVKTQAELWRGVFLKILEREIGP